MRVVVGLDSWWWVWTPGVGYESSTSRKEPEVSQNNIDQGQAAETPTQETKAFIRQVRSASSWKGSEEK